MPTLRPLHWLLALVVLAFYGFAVFAVTRDYYIRHPIRPTVAQNPPGTAVARLPKRSLARPVGVARGACSGAAPSSPTAASASPRQTAGVTAAA
jgi:hypothetical protein